MSEPEYVNQVLDRPGSAQSLKSRCSTPLTQSHHSLPSYGCHSITRIHEVRQLEHWDDMFQSITLPQDDIGMLSELSTYDLTFGIEISQIRHY